MMKHGFVKSKVRNIGQVYSGATPKTENPSFWNGDILWLTPNDLSKNKSAYFSDTERKITKEGLNRCSAHLLPKDTLVMSSRAPIGYLAIGKNDFSTNQGCKSILFYEDFDPLFFYYNFQHQIGKLKQLGEGTTFAEISKSYLEEFEISFPESKPEQTSIAEILSTADTAIARTEALMAKYQRIKTGLMQDLLTRGIDANGNIRSKATHRFVVKKGIEVPEEWEVDIIDNVGSVTKLAGYEYSKYFNYSIGGEIIALRALNIKNEEIVLNDIQTIPKKVSDFLIRSKINKNDILITYIGAYIGDVLMINENDKYHLAPNIAKVTAGKKLLPKYLEIILRSHFVQSQIKNLVVTTATPSLTMGQIRKVILVYPKDEKEQERIINSILTIKENIKAEQKILSKLHSLKTGLMQDLLSGRVRVKVNNG